MYRRLVNLSLVLAAVSVSFAWDNMAAADERDTPPKADGNQPAARLAKVAEGKIRRGEEGFRALYTMNRDGTNVEYLTTAPGMISSSCPEWSHDGRMIAFDGCAKIDAVIESKVFVAAIEGP